MNSGQTILSQILSYIDYYQFQKCVSKYKGNYRVKTFTCWEQFIVMLFAQLTYRESLRDIESCLQAQTHKTYHIGIKSKISKSTLSEANESRDWRIYAEFTQLLINQAIELYKDEELAFELKNTAYALDSTTIDLCLSIFPWAKFRKNKGAVKMHTLLNIQGSIPTFIEITNGLCHDVNILDVIIPEPNSFYIMDRGYIDYSRLFYFNKTSAFFVIRAKTNLKFRRLYSNKIDKSTSIKCDQIIKLTNSEKYQDKLRRVKIFDSTNKKHIVLLTNKFDYPPQTISELYKNRWKIELFFKWIKQHLRIKAFFGTSENAVKTQIWIAISSYILIAIIKKKLEISNSLYNILQILSITLFEKVLIYQLLNKYENPLENSTQSNQLELFNL